MGRVDDFAGGSPDEDEALFAELGDVAAHPRVCFDRPRGFATACRNAWLYLSGSIRGTPPADDPFVDVSERRRLQAAAQLPATERIELLIAFAVDRGGSEAAVRSVVEQRRGRGRSLAEVRESKRASAPRRARLSRGNR